MTGSIPANSPVVVLRDALHGKRTYAVEETAALDTALADVERLVRAARELDAQPLWDIDKTNLREALVHFIEEWA